MIRTKAVGQRDCKEVSSSAEQAEEADEPLGGTREDEGAGLCARGKNTRAQPARSLSAVLDSFANRQVEHPGYSGYNLAIMYYEIILAPEAANDLKCLKAHLRAEVRDALERHLRHEPTKIGRSRIKRLRGLSRPQYRLRVGEIRVFYDVSKDAVEVLAIVAKSQSEDWLREAGEII
jgi:mRNA interferase RelE/StbE